MEGQGDKRTDVRNNDIKEKFMESYKEKRRRVVKVPRIVNLDDGNCGEG